MPDLYVIAMIVVPVHLPVLLMPGANAALVSSIGLLYGRKAAVRAAIGITTGSTILITIALLFANTIFNLSPQTLFAIKVVGALYLLYLAILALRPPKTKPKKDSQHPFWFGMLTEATNPRTILFFITVLSLVSRYQSTLPALITAGSIIISATLLYHVALALIASEKTISHLARRYATLIRYAAAIIFVYAAWSLIFQG